MTIFSNAEGYNQYRRDISSIRLVDVFSTIEGIQHIGGISSVRWKDILSMTKGYLQLKVFSTVVMLRFYIE